MLGRAEQLGRKAMALTDHDGVWGIPFIEKNNKNGMKLLYGAEMRMIEKMSDLKEVKKNHITMISKSQKGWSKLCNLITRSYDEDHFYYYPTLDIEMMKEGAGDIVVMSGCMSSLVSKCLLDNNLDKAMEIAKQFKDIFGKDYYLEIIPIENFPDSVSVLATGLRKISKALDIPVVLTHDVHQIQEGQVDIWKMLHCIKQRKTMEEIEQQTFATDCYQMEDEAAYQSALKTLGDIFSKEEILEMFHNQERIVSDCESYQLKKGKIVQFKNAREILERKAWEGLAYRGFSGNKVYEDRLSYELDLITQKDFCDYFLIVSDLTSWAKRTGYLVGSGRGCFLPGSKVRSINGRDYSIEDVKIGTHVLTSQAHYKKVVDKYVYDIDEECIRITLDNNKIIECTSDHKILTMDSDFVAADRLVVGQKLSCPTQTTWKTITLQCFDCGKQKAYSIKNAVQRHDPYRCAKCSAKYVANTEKGLKQRRDAAQLSKREDVKDKISKSVLIAMDNGLRDRIAAGGKKYRDKFKVDNPGQRLPCIEGLWDAVERDPSIVDKFNRSFQYGYFISEKNNKEIFYQSSYELQALKILEADNNVKSFYRYQKLIPYVLDGNPHNYKPDFFVEYYDRCPSLLEVKAKWQVESKDKNFSAKCEVAMQLCESNHWDFVIWSDKELFNDFLHDEVAIKTIESFNYKGKVYDLNVEDDHTYTVSGVGVHNSAAGGLICYVLRITEIDPVFHDVMFERFISVDRMDPPDIDIDFQSSARQDVLHYLYTKYGRDRAAQIGAFSTFGGKNTLDEVGKMYRVPKFEVESLKDKLVTRIGVELRASFTIMDTIEGFRDAKLIAERYPVLLNAVKLEGQIRHFGAQAAGAVVNSFPLNYITPLMERQEKHMVFFDGEISKYLNILKIDTLGINALDKINTALDAIGKDYDWLSKASYEDDKTFKLFNDVDVKGIFQYEKNTGPSLLRQIHIDNFEDLVALNALARPGPLHSGATQIYTRAKSENNPQAWNNEVMDKITERTHGVIIYQEQTMACLPGDTKVICKTNRKRYDKMEIIPGAKDIKEIEEGDEVLTYNEKTREKEFKKVKTVMNRSAEESVVITFSNGNKLELTSEHPVAIDKSGTIKWIKAGDIRKGDKALQYDYMGLPFRLHSLWRNNKSYDEIYGETEGDKLKRKIGDNTVERWSDLGSSLRSSESRNKRHESLLRANADSSFKQNRMKGLREWNEYITDKNIHDIYDDNQAKIILEKMSQKQKIRWRDNKHEILKSMAKKPNSLETDFGLLLNCNFPNQWEYVGNYKLMIGRGKTRCPDFVHAKSKKVIEIFHDYYKIKDYGSVSNYKRVTSKFYHQNGYEVCYFSKNDIYKNTIEVLDKVLNFSYNPKIECVSVVKIDKTDKKQRVYNLEIEDNNNYFAYGILVHNCCRLLGHMEWADISHVRTIMSKSMGKEYFEKYREKFVTGSTTQGGVTEEFANHVFDHICLLPFTKVTCKEGTKIVEKNIVDVKIGDWVASLDRDFSIVYNPVSRIYENSAIHLMNVVFDNGTNIKCTPSHPFYVMRGLLNGLSNRWIKAMDLSVGDECVRLLEGNLANVTIKQVDFSTLKDWQKVYNLEVEFTHNYFAEGICLSNCTHGQWSFNRGHSVSYTDISYKMAYLKAYYPRHFYYSLLMNEDVEDKVNGYLRDYIEKGYGRILPPKLNHSDTRWKLEGNDLRAGLTQIKGLGEKAAEHLISLYPIKDMEDLKKRAIKRVCNIRIIRLVEEHKMLTDEEDVDVFGLYDFAERMKNVERTHRIGDITYQFKARPVILAGVLSRQVNQKNLSELEISVKLKDYSRYNKAYGDEFAIFYLKDETQTEFQCIMDNKLYPKYKDLLWSTKVGADIIRVKGSIPPSKMFVNVQDIESYDDQKHSGCACYKCPMIKNNFVPPFGNKTSSIMIIGEAPGKCFPAGVKVCIPRKRVGCPTGGGYQYDKECTVVSNKRIEDVMIGDQVYTINMNTMKKELDEVVDTFIREEKEFVIATFSDGLSLKMTIEHPIYVTWRNGKLLGRWINARDLQNGDKCIRMQYEGLSREKLNKQNRRYGNKSCTGLIPWNKDLTKETDTRVLKNSLATSEGAKKLRQDPQSIYNTEQYRINMSISQSVRHKNNPLSEDTKNKMFLSQIALFKDSSRARKRSSGRKSNKLENTLNALLQQNFPDEWIYIGDGKHEKSWIDGINPDFVHSKFDNKIIEVFSKYWKILSYGSVKKYKMIRRKQFEERGKDILFLERELVCKNPDKAVKLVRDFVFNPNAYSVEIIDVRFHIEKEPIKVYDLQMKNNHNFFANGIFVHNSEVEKGQPFVGRAGAVLGEILAELGLDRSHLYISNSCFCRPTDGNKNRTPTDEEISCCRGHLGWEIEEIKPRVVVAMGKIAASAILNKKIEEIKIGKLVETVIDLETLSSKYKGALLIPSYHPAAVLYGDSNSGYRDSIKNSLKLALDESNRQIKRKIKKESI